MISPRLSRSETLALLVLSACSVGVLANVFQGDGNPVAASLALSGIAFAATYCLIKWLADTFVRAGLKGRDMAKLKGEEMYNPSSAIYDR
jgi:UDP-N-acetylglucosamine--dolichyl-phosphate N-acetylglucosaminephosphotransferase